MESNLPKISIITPSYNQAEFIEETILSVINQNYPNLEYIVIDGGSTDGSVDIIKKYEKYLTYWVSEKDNGHADALNKGFAKATGDIMAWINSDDKYFPWTLETVAEVFTQHKDINWIVGLYSNFDRKGRLMTGYSNIRAEYRNLYSYIFNDLHIQQESVFWRRTLWEKTGSYIDSNIRLMIDTELWCRFFLEDELWHVDRVLGGFRSYGLNRSNVYKKEVAEDINTCIEQFLKNLPEDKKKVIAAINSYSTDLKIYYQGITEISNRLNQNFLIQSVPHFMYKKLHDFLYRKMAEKRNLKDPIKPRDESLVIRRLLNINDQWIKNDLDYQFPY